MDFQTVRQMCRRLEVNPTVDLIEKTMECYRRVEALRGSLAGLSLNSPTKLVLCIEIACRACKTTLSKNECVRHSGLSRKAYLRAFQVFERLLLGDSENKQCLRELAVRVGCLDAGEIAQAALDSYRENIQGQVASARKDDVNVSAPVFAAAALFCVCRCLKMRPNKRRLLKEAHCTMTELERRCAELEKFAESAVSKWRTSLSGRDGQGEKSDDAVAESSSRSRSRKRRHSVESDDESRGVVFCSYKPTAEYFKWKKDLLKKAELALRIEASQRT